MDVNVQFGFHYLRCEQQYPLTCILGIKRIFFICSYHHRVDWEYFGVAFAALGTDGVEYSSKQRAIF